MPELRGFRLAGWSLCATFFVTALARCGSDSRTEPGAGGAMGGASAGSGGAAPSSGGIAGSSSGTAGTPSAGSGASPANGGSAGDANAGSAGDTSGGSAGTANGGDAGEGGEGGDPGEPCIPIEIAAPQEITEPGCYLLVADLSQAETVLSIHDTTDVELDCAGHSIVGTATVSGAISVKNVQRLGLRRCTVRANASDGGFVSFGMMLDNVSTATLTDNDLRAVNVNLSSDLTVTDNFVRFYFQAYYTTGSLIQNNMFEGDQSITIAAPIVLARGGDNVVRGNNVDGKWNGDPGSTLAADDGVILQDEIGDLIEDNTFVNNWDCGIETVGIVADSVFTGNIVSKSNYCCIGAWYSNNWRNNVVSDNQCSDVGALFQFRRIFDLAPGETTFYFQDNVFENNVQLPGGFETPSVFDFLNLPAEIAPEDVVLGNNRFTNNTFRSATPVLIPESMYVDGGGNVCQSGSDDGHALGCGRP